MALLFDLPSQETIVRNGKVKVLAAPTGLRDIEYDQSTSKDDYIERGFYEVEVGVAPI